MHGFDFFVVSYKDLCVISPFPFSGRLSESVEYTLMGSEDEETGNAGFSRHRGHDTCPGICIDITKWLPVLFIISVISWSYYAFVIQLCLLSMPDIWLQIVSLTLYHIFLTLFLWSYWQTIFSKSGRIPRKFRISPGDLDRVESAQSEAEVNQVLDSIVRANQLPVLTRTNITQIRYCEKCSIIKPDRCHHCSVCRRCVLKMDHHCPWVNNCVCFDNYKFFVLFLFYAFSYCFVIFVFSLPYFVQFWSRERNEIGTAADGGKFHILFVFFVAVMFALSLVSLFLYHIYLITKNRSTLEAFRSPIFIDGPDRKGFSLGAYYNFLEIFGENKTTWFLPIFTSLGDGIAFPTRQNRIGAMGNYNSIDITDTSSTPPEHENGQDMGLGPKPDSQKPNLNIMTEFPMSRQVNGQGRVNEANGNPSSVNTSSETTPPLVSF